MRRFLNYASDLFDANILFFQVSESLELSHTTTEYEPIGARDVLMQSWVKFSSDFHKEATDLIATDDSERQKKKPK